MLYSMYIEFFFFLPAILLEGEKKKKKKKKKKESIWCVPVRVRRRGVGVPAGFF